MLVNTCAVRDNAEQRVHRAGGRAAAVQAAGRRARRGRLHGAAARPRAAGARAAGGPGGRPRRLPQPARADRRRGPRRAARHRHRVPRLGALRGRAAGARAEPDARSSRCSAAAITVHLLHRSVHARTGAEPQAGGRGARGRGAGRERHHRGDAARARRSTATTTARTTSPTCCAAVGAVDGIRRLRFTSPYPTDFTAAGDRRHGATPAVCEHVHLPVQSGSNAVLRRMLRRYTRERYLEVVAELRSAIPGLTITTDIIVGFPGETEAQFAETLSLVSEADFDEAYTFKYSVREGTPAVRLRGPRPRRRRVGTARAAHRGRARATRGGRTSGASARCTRCWSSARRAGATSCSRARAPTSSVLVDLPPSAASASITRCSSPGPPVPPSPGRCVVPQLAVL